jgi:lysophospholipase L1-like esterase
MNPRRAAAWSAAGVSVLLAMALLLVSDRALDYRDALRHAEHSFLNEGLHLTSNDAIRSADLHPLGVFIGGSLVRYWFLPADLPLAVVNRGGLEESIGVTRKRFPETVVAPGADVVLVNAGFCDLHNGVRSAEGGEAAVRRVFAGLQEIVGLARAHGVRPVLSTLTPVRPSLLLRALPWLDLPDGAKERESAAIRLLNDRLRVYARQEGILLLDFFSAVVDDKGELRRSFSARDGEHLNAAGYQALNDVARRALSSMSGRRALLKTAAPSGSPKSHHALQVP